MDKLIDFITEPNAYEEEFLDDDEIESETVQWLEEMRLLERYWDPCYLLWEYLQEFTAITGLPLLDRCRPHHILQLLR